MPVIRTLALAIFAVGSLLAVAPAPAQIAIGISVNVAPPALPVYVQPPIPSPGYIWAPGYWAWDDEVGYYWVPGTWVSPPGEGLLWTPGYWGWTDGVYSFHAGYWGPTVGFYGGVAYGFGYTGVGLQPIRCHRHRDFSTTIAQDRLASRMIVEMNQSDRAATILPHQ